MARRKKTIRRSLIEGFEFITTFCVAFLLVVLTVAVIISLFQ